MRNLSVLCLLALSFAGTRALADEVSSLPGDPGVACESVTLESGQPALSCTSEDRSTTLAVADTDPSAYHCWRVCKVRVIGPCLVWHRVCR